MRVEENVGKLSLCLKPTSLCQSFQSNVCGISCASLFQYCPSIVPLLLMRSVELYSSMQMYSANAYILAPVVTVTPFTLIPIDWKREQYKRLSPDVNLVAAIASPVLVVTC